MTPSGLRTTCIGAYPKPDWLPVRDWFQLENGQSSAGSEVTRRYSAAIAGADAGLEKKFIEATRQAVADQIACGIDIPTDGEQRRENYIHYHCRHLDGFDFDNLTHRIVRGGAYETDLPTIRGRVRAKPGHFLDRDWVIAQNFTDRPVKITVPGPVTIMDTTADAFYGDERALAFDLAAALNHEIRALADAGCAQIQVDEPMFARRPEAALSYGLEALERCFHKAGEGVTRTMHMCCGYPNHLDDTTYPKADPGVYPRLAGELDGVAIDAVSIEDAHRHNDLALLEKFAKKTVVFGAVAIAESRIEPVEEIAERLKSALDHIDRHRLIAAPDCGLGFLGRTLAMDKLRNLTAAARIV